MTDTVRIRIHRQDGPEARPHVEEFAVPRAPGMTVVSALLHVRANPVTVDGKPTAPVAFQASCLSDQCGSCAMNVNGVPTQACTVRLDDVEDPVVLAPLKKFPLVKDLVVDRQRIREVFRRAETWITVDTLEDLGPGPRQAATLAVERSGLNHCTGCGACLEACPNHGPHSAFVGAAPIHDVRLANLHPTGALQSSGRLAQMMDKGGVADCGNAQNCVKVCPVGLPLTTSIASVNRQVNRKAVRDLLGA